MSRPVLFDLRDRVILITGAASGIGLDTARRAAARGARIALVDIDADAVQRAAASIGARAAAFTADVTDRDALATAVDAVVARFGGIDAVVVNAGVPPVVGSVLAVDEDAWERVLEINLGGAYRTIKATLPHVVERRGHILLVASAYAFAPGVAVSCYAASKAGVEALGRALRIELEPHATTVGIAYFGFIDTPLVQRSFADPLAQRMRATLPGFIARPLPVGRAGAAMVRGLERRSARIMVPRYVSVMSTMRGLLPATMDAQMQRDQRLTAAIRDADEVATAADKKLTPTSPSG